MEENNKENPIVLISCSKKKIKGKHPAEKLYDSPLFKKSLQYTKEVVMPNKIFILSDKYGLVELNQELPNYSKKIEDKQERKDWSDRVFKQLKEKTDIENSNFIFLAGKDYYEFLAPKLPCSEFRLKGIIGKQLEWFNEQLGIK